MACKEGVTSMVRALVPWDLGSSSLLETTPRVFNRFRREMDRLMSDFFGGEETMEITSVFVPQMNVAETDKCYEVTLDLPGMTRDDINVELREGNLFISGHREEEREETGKTFRRIERSAGRFMRTIPVGPNVQPDQINAEYKDGVLKVTLPKSEAAQPKRIEVKS
jgi:HSP20 family protein